MLSPRLSRYLYTLGYLEEESSRRPRSSPLPPLTRTLYNALRGWMHCGGGCRRDMFTLGSFNHNNPNSYGMLHSASIPTSTPALHNNPRYSRRSIDARNTRQLRGLWMLSPILPRALRTDQSAGNKNVQIL